MSLKKFNYVCSKCGGENVLFDAYVTWNKELQNFEVDNVFDEGHYCTDCDGECSINEVIIEEAGG